MSFNLESVLSLSIPRNYNASPTSLLKWNILYPPPLFGKTNGTLMPSRNLISILLYNYTIIINLVLTLHKTLSTITKPNTLI